MAPELLVLALEYRRQPSRFRYLEDPQVPLPASFDALVSDLGCALSAARVAETAASLGCSPEELRAAALQLLRQVLLVPSASHERVLGIGRSARPDLVAEHYRVLVALFHPDRNPPEAHEQNAADASRINTAYRALKQSNPLRPWDEGLADRSRRARRLVDRGRVAAKAAVARRGLSGSAAPGLGVFGGAGFILCALWVWWIAGPHPFLRMAGRDGAPAESKPFFLSHSNGLEALQHPGESGRNLSLPATYALAPVAETLWPEPMSTPQGVLRDNEADSPDLLLADFERNLLRGDLAGILRLMTDQARITSAGVQDPRGGRDLFQSAIDRRLRLGPLSLKDAGGTRLRAEGRLERAVAAGSSGKAAIGEEVGRIVLEIVRQDTLYRISALDYRIESSK